jgi:hypothetical protein
MAYSIGIVPLLLWTLGNFLHRVGRDGTGNHSKCATLFTLDVPREYYSAIFCK